MPDLASIVDTRVAVIDESSEDCMLVDMQANVGFKFPTFRFSCVSCDLELLLRSVGLVVNIIWSKIMIEQVLICEATVPGPLCRLDVSPAIESPAGFGNQFPNPETI